MTRRCARCMQQAPATFTTRARHETQRFPSASGAGIGLRLPARLHADPSRPSLNCSTTSSSATSRSCELSAVTHERRRGINRPVPGAVRCICIPDRRPKPFVIQRRRSAPGNATPLAHHYLRIRTKGGHEGIYGYRRRRSPARHPWARCAACSSARTRSRSRTHLGPDVPLEPPFARQPLHDGASATSTTRCGTCAAAIFGAPVFRLLGGPTQQPVRVYGSCLGFSIDPAARGQTRRAACRRMASSIRNGSWATARRRRAKAWI